MPEYTTEELRRLAEVMNDRFVESLRSDLPEQVSRIWVETYVVDTLLGLADFPYQLLYYWVIEVRDIVKGVLDATDKMISAVGDYNPNRSMGSPPVGELVGIIREEVADYDRMSVGVPTRVGWMASRIERLLAERIGKSGSGVPHDQEGLKREVASFLLSVDALHNVGVFVSWLGDHKINIDRLFQVKVRADLRRIGEALGVVKDARDMWLLAKTLSGKSGSNTTLIPNVLESERDTIESSSYADPQDVDLATAVYGPFPVSVDSGSMPITIDGVEYVVNHGGASSAVLVSDHTYDIGGVYYFYLHDGTTTSRIVGDDGYFTLASAEQWGIIVDGISYTVTVPADTYSSSNDIVPILKTATAQGGAAVTDVITITRIPVSNAILFAAKTTGHHRLKGDPDTSATIGVEVGTWRDSSTIRDTASTSDINVYAWGPESNKLGLEVDFGSEQLVTFSNGWVTASSVVTALGAISGTTSSMNSGVLTIQSSSIGVGSRLYVSTGSTDLGFVQGTNAQGDDYNAEDLLGDIRGSSVKDEVDVSIKHTGQYSGRVKFTAAVSVTLLDSPPDNIALPAKLVLKSGDSVREARDVQSYTKPVVTLSAGFSSWSTSGTVLGVITTDVVEVRALLPHHDLRLTATGGIPVMVPEGTATARLFSVSTERGLRWVRPGDLIAGGAARVLWVDEGGGVIGVDPPQSIHNTVVGEVSSAEYQAWVALKGHSDWDYERADWGWLLNQVSLYANAAVKSEAIQHLNGLKSDLGGLLAALDDFVSRIRPSSRISALLDWLRSHSMSGVAHALTRLDFDQAIGPYSLSRLEDEFMGTARKVLGGVISRGPELVMRDVAEYTDQHDELDNGAVDPVDEVDYDFDEPFPW